MEWLNEFVGLVQQRWQHFLLPTNSFLRMYSIIHFGAICGTKHISQYNICFQRQAAVIQIFMHYHLSTRAPCMHGIGIMKCVCFFPGHFVRCFLRSEFQFSEVWECSSVQIVILPSKSSWNFIWVKKQRLRASFMMAFYFILSLKFDFIQNVFGVLFHKYRFSYSFLCVCGRVCCIAYKLHVWKTASLISSRRVRMWKFELFVARATIVKLN